MGRLAGKRALVTGAGGNLGSEIARAFAAEGADLILTSRDRGRLDALAGDARAMGVRATVIPADFTVEAEVDHLASAAWDAFGGIDIILFSSQPPDPQLGTLLTTPEPVWLELQTAMVWGPLRLMRSLAPRMIAAGTGGSIITLTSSTSDDPMPGFDAYGLAKATLWSMTLYMAREWGEHGIRVNAFQPGLVATAGNVEELQETVRKAGLLKRTALGRIGANSDCVGAVVFLASDEPISAHSG